MPPENGPVTTAAARLGGGGFAGFDGVFFWFLKWFLNSFWRVLNGF